MGTFVTQPLWAYVIALFLIIAPVLLALAMRAKPDTEVRLHLWPPKIEIGTKGKLDGPDAGARQKRNRKKKRKRAGKSSIR